MFKAKQLNLILKEKQRQETKRHMWAYTQSKTSFNVFTCH